MVSGGECGSQKVNELLQIDDVARALGVSRRSVYRLADAGRLPRPLKVGRLNRWRRAEIDEWIAAGCPRVDVQGGRRPAQRQ